MSFSFVRQTLTLALCCILVAALPKTSSAQWRADKTQPIAATSQPQLIYPEELVKILHSGKSQPLILNIGPRMLYLQAHITGAEFIGAGSEPEGIKQLRSRVQSIPHTASIILYCGCCPWAHCPNVNPAYAELHRMGFTNVKVLYIANNIGTDWVYKGYPTVLGKQ